MPRETASRAARLLRLRELLLANPHGYTTRELAEATGAHIRAIQRDMRDLDSMVGVAVYQDGRRWKALEAPAVGPLDFTIPEARAVYVAMRLFLRYADEADPSAASALGKLVRHLPQTMRTPVQRTITALQARPFRGDFVRILDVVTFAWARQRVLDLQYRSAGRDDARQVIIEPYFMEASASGYSTYLIGYSRTHGAVRTLKVERIVDARETQETFTPRDDIDVDELLRNSWGIMWGEDTEVVLRFDPDVAWRVKEAVWHPSQRIEESEDGGCTLRMQVGHTMEVAPWVRGWGGAVEVLAPPEFREEIAAEARRLAARYGTGGE